MKPTDIVFSTDWDAGEPTWREKRYTPMAELVFGKDKPVTEETDNDRA